jgi:hypothetical protein
VRKAPGTRHGRQLDVYPDGFLAAYRDALVAEGDEARAEAVGALAAAKDEASTRTMDARGRFGGGRGQSRGRIQEKAQEKAHQKNV